MSLSSYYVCDVLSSATFLLIHHRCHASFIGGAAVVARQRRGLRHTGQLRPLICVVGCCDVMWRGVAGARVGAVGRDARGGAAVVAGQRRGLLHTGALRLLMSPRPATAHHTYFLFDRTNCFVNVTIID